MKKIGQFEIKTKTYTTEINLKNLNIGVNSIYYKNDPNCGACELINQNPVLNKNYN